MKIKHIRKTGLNKYEIELEEKKIKTYDTIMLKYQIALKKELSEELIEQIEEETKASEQLEKAVQFMNRKLRSEKEVKDYLKKQGVENIEDMIEELNKRHLFNHSAYIKAYIHDRFTFSNEGPNKIKEDLVRQNFQEEQVIEELDKIEEEEVINKLSKLIKKKLNSNHRYSSEHFKQKILDQMMLLGYQKKMVLEILEQQEINHDDILEREARKLYQKYKDKKTEQELPLFLKQKLYQKQYPIEEIHQVLEKIQKENSN